MRGVFIQTTVFHNGSIAQLYIISRRNRFRDGTRKTRGIDKNGDVANFVETEQIIHHRNNLVSYVQIRGSVPLRWEQSGYKYTPIPKILNDENQQAYFLKHFEKLKMSYPHLIIYNLLSGKGVEQELCDTYTKFCDQHLLGDVYYVHYDFNEKCKSNYNNLKQELPDEVERLQFFHKHEDSIIQRQQGYLRVNCLDCLDRTNLVQCHFALKALGDMIVAAGLPLNQDLVKTIESMFMEMWAGNGDGISIQYAGTKALKTDFVRTGKQEKKGLMRDGANSLSRYYIGIFKDRFRKLAIDLFYGHFDVDTSLSIWSKEQRKVLDECLSYIETTMSLLDDEMYVDTSLVYVLGQDEERVIILTTQTLLIMKYKFNEHLITGFSKIPLLHIKKINYGIEEDQKSVKLQVQLSGSKQYTFSFKNSSSSASMKFVESLIESVQLLNPNFDPMELTLGDQE